MAKMTKKEEQALIEDLSKRVKDTYYYRGHDKNEHCVVFVEKTSGVYSYFDAYACNIDQKSKDIISANVVKTFNPDKSNSFWHINGSKNTGIPTNSNKYNKLINTLDYSVKEKRAIEKLLQNKVEDLSEEERAIVVQGLYNVIATEIENRTNAQKEHDRIEKEKQALVKKLKDEKFVKNALANRDTMQKVINEMNNENKVLKQDLEATRKDLEETRVALAAERQAHAGTRGALASSKKKVGILKKVVVGLGIAAVLVAGAASVTTWSISHKDNEDTYQSGYVDGYNDGYEDGQQQELTDQEGPTDQDPSVSGSTTDETALEDAVEAAVGEDVTIIYQEEMEDTTTVYATSEDKLYELSVTEDNGTYDVTVEKTSVELSSYFDECLRDSLKEEYQNLTETEYDAAVDTLLENLENYAKSSSSNLKNVDSVSLYVDNNSRAVYNNGTYYVVDVDLTAVGQNGENYVVENIDCSSAVTKDVAYDVNSATLASVLNLVNSHKSIEGVNSYSFISSENVDKWTTPVESSTDEYSK